MKFCLVILLSFFVSFAWADFIPSSFSANFTQEYISTLKGKTKKGNGTIDYKYPSNIRLETMTPSHVLFVSNGTKNWYYTFPFEEGEEGQLIESSGKENVGFFSKLFDSLKTGLKTNNLYLVESKKNEATVTFKGKYQKEIGMKAARIYFLSEKVDFTNVEKIELEFLDSKKSTMKLNDIKINVSFQSDKFNFVAPKNTKLVER